MPARSHPWERIANQRERVEAMSDLSCEPVEVVEAEEEECNCTQCRMERGSYEEEEEECEGEDILARSEEYRAPKREELLQDRVEEDAERVQALLGHGRRVRFVADLSTLRDRLKAKGWEHLGRGAFSVAYGKGDLVWKVSRQFAGHEDGGREYAADCAAGTFKGSIHAPRVRLMLIDNNGDYACLMERMDGDMDDAGYDETRSVMASLEKGMGWSFVSSSETEADPAFVAFVQSLRGNYEGRYQFDLHGGNIMRRARDGEWVITDPISWPAN